MARLLAAGCLALVVLTACGNQTDVAQIKAVIEKADHEQEDAFAAHDPTIMQDTNTARNFAVMVRTNEQFSADGIVGIRLTNLEWGDIQTSSDTKATATNWETWEQTDSDGNTQSSREREIYQLMKIGGSWKIDQIDYPDDTADGQSSSGQPSPSQ